MEMKPAATTTTGLPLKAKKLSISILVISLPVLYVSLLRIPPSTLLKDTAFWFLMSNSLILIVAADSGVFSSSSAAAAGDELHDEYIRYSRASMSAPGAAAVLVVRPPMEIAENHIQRHDQERSAPAAEPQNKPTPPPTPAVERSLSAKETFGEENKAIVLHQNPSPSVAEQASPALRRSATEKRIECRATEDSEYSNLSDEELNRRVEEFIRRFNRDIRLESRDELMN